MGFGTFPARCRPRDWLYAHNVWHKRREPDKAGLENPDLKRVVTLVPRGCGGGSFIRHLKAIGPLEAYGQGGRGGMIAERADDRGVCRFSVAGTCSSQGSRRLHTPLMSMTNPTVLIYGWFVVGAEGGERRPTRRLAAGARARGVGIAWDAFNVREVRITMHVDDVPAASRLAPATGRRVVILICCSRIRRFRPRPAARRN
jgi:hypothetical protein